MAEEFNVVAEEVLDAAFETKCIWFRIEDNKQLDFKPGQFMTMILPKDNIKVRKHYSISSSPFMKNKFEICVNRVPEGFGSNFLCDIKPGTKLSCEGPFGVFVLKEPLQNDPVFIATGTGVAPIKSMLDVIWKNKLDTGRDIWLLFGARYEKSIIYDKEFKEMQKAHPNFHYIPTVTREGESWKGHKGYVQEQLKKYIKSPDKKEAYVCGLMKMVSDVRKTLADMGFPKDRIYFENYV